MEGFKIKTHSTTRYEKGKIFAWMGLITSIGFSNYTTVVAVILSQKLHSEVYVGYFFAFIAFISLLTSLGSSILLKRFSKASIAKWCLIIGSAAYVLFGVSSQVWQYLLFDTVRVVSLTLLLIALGIFVRDFAKANKLAVAEGRYYLFCNIGWIFGPLIGGVIASKWGNPATFLFSGMTYIAALAMFLHEKNIIKNPHIHDRKESAKLHDFFADIESFFSRKDLLKSFALGFGLYFWWTIYKIYVPIAIHSSGYGQEVVGFIISAGMLPIVLWESIITKIARQNGLLKYITFGFTWIGIFVFSFAVIKIPVALLMVMILVNVGAAFVEPLHEPYFFGIAEGKDGEKYYGIYNTSYPLANITIPLFGSFILSFTNMNGLWISCALIFFIIAALAFHLEKKKLRV